MKDTDERKSQPRVHRGVRIGLVARAYCALIATTAFLFIPWREVLIRWRRTVPNLVTVIGCAGLLHWYGMPAAAAAVVAVPTLFLSLTIAMALMMRWSVSDMWHVRDGIDGAVILTQRMRRQDRQVLHTWATFRHRRGLGRAVLDAAWADAPRPLWLDPATPSLRRLYLSRGAVPDPDGSRWLVIGGE